MKKMILKTNQLKKKYGDFVALDHVDITIHKKDIYCL